ncbi:MAG TPA: hypothetical protein VHM89_05210 [Acidimicrobiales bacterium]|nr:hypothetical protein [Acidimicrobiales bacterium]
MDPKVAFWFYLAAVVCFVLAAAGEGWRFGSLGRRGAAPRISLVPLGLALFAFPTMWTVGTQAF